MKNFQTAYAALNASQKQAVDTIEGPVLVIAGPGTGKTQLLSVRVANILQKTDASPENILCLTFTNKAAHNMRERLISLIGPTAYDVCVKTFHSFAADIMNEYPDYFWNGARLSTVPDAVQLDILTTLLQALPLDHPLARRFGVEFTGIKDVLQALKLVKEAGLTPDKLRAIISANLAYIDIAEPILVKHAGATLSSKKLPALYEVLEAELPEQAIDAAIAPLKSLRSVLLESVAFAIQQDEVIGKTTHTGAWKRRFLQTVEGTKSMQDERARNAWWLGLADMYEHYREALHERGYYDFADMLVEVISAIEQHPALRADLQERHQYLLIDEFQDTNPAQMRLAHLIATSPQQDTPPNIMAVGDDDQSIFKFNGAELNNMFEFRSLYGIEAPIVLTANYRSTQDVLTTAQKVASQAADRLVHRDPNLIKDIVAAREGMQQGTIVHVQYPSRHHQLSAVARQIQELRNAQKPGTNTIAVLARSHDSLRQIAGILSALDVPVQYEQQNNILEHPAVKQILLIADALVTIADGDEAAVNMTLSQLLRHPMWGIPPQELWRLAIANRYKPHWLNYMMEQSELGLKKIAESLLALAQIASYEPLPLMLEYIIGLRPYGTFTSPFYSYFIAEKELTSQYVETLSALQLLRSLANDFSRRGEATVADFVRFVRLNSTHKRLITDETIFVSGTHAVQLLTVHKAKGLEFDAVFIIDGVEDSWKPPRGGRKPPANLPLQAAGEVMDDYIRLFFVAVTRAKHTVYVTSYATDDTGKEVLPAPFIQAALTSKIVSESEAGDLVTVLQDASTWPHLSSSDEQTILQPVLEDFRLSATSLLQFLDISQNPRGPQYFKERSLLRLPEAKTIHQSFGTAMHAAMEFAQKLTNQDAFDIDEVLQAFEDALAQEHVGHDDFERFVPLGQQLLGELFESYGYQLQKGSMGEQKLSCTLPEGAEIGGTLDRIDTTTPTAVTIVDYKSGTPLSSFSSKNQHTAIKAWRHRTQLIYYTLLLRHTPRFKKAKEIVGQMVYLEAGSPKDLLREYAPTPEDIDRLEKLVQIVWNKVQACDFPDTSHYPQTMDGIRQFEDDLLSGKI